ncbi:uncharacterized protein BCR38DRAFT_376712 [Pseudomassariella vexata]|uniref:Uncharacterized protein n=1 Tax=Pseudomassariella vexata TaxID=1141098 RepID=A0A1Y2DHP3_9PEZI|nr:uncharacterized protein BCR38DRAFT_376712 [Pseudomassariella vexata]ORY58767.1 hypothetical protein BCR38DRAFT_376712 [Pseudomassariella vexata]
MIGSHRDQAHFGRAKWRKRVLLPCWIIQVALLLSLMGIFSYRLSNTISGFEAEKVRGAVPMVEFVWECFNIGFALISFIINLIQISKFIAEALTPFAMMFGNIISLVLSLAVLALDVVVYIQRADRHYSIVALAMDCALLLFTIIPTIYGAIVYRRLLKYDDYHLPHNVKHFGFSAEAETANNPSRPSLSASPAVPYDPTNSASSRPRGPSFTFRRTSSNASVSPQPRPTDERRASYGHKRDTQFDEYVARRSSIILQEGVERALGAEFGWSKDRLDGVVSVGSVTSSQARPRGNSLGRQPSWEVNVAAEIPTLTDDPIGIQRGRSLVSVPEGLEEEEDIGARKGRLMSRDRDILFAGDMESRRISAISAASYQIGSEDIDLDGNNWR